MNKRCPVCGTRMEVIDIDGISSYRCTKPTCGYVEPVNPNHWSAEITPGPKEQEKTEEKSAE